MGDGHVRVPLGMKPQYVFDCAWLDGVLTLRNARSLQSVAHRTSFMSYFRVMARTGVFKAYSATTVVFNSAIRRSGAGT